MALAQVTEFANEAGENLDIAGPLIERLAQPIQVHKVAVGGSSPPLETFAIAVAATLTLAFVTVLLVAGSLALEREENAYPRLVRGLVSQRGAARREGPARGRGRPRRHDPDARRADDLRAARMEPLRPLAGGDPARRRRRWRRPGRRSARRRARSAPSPCSPSWSPCRSPSSRWSRRARSASGLFDVIKVITAIFPFKPALEAITAALEAGNGSHRQPAAPPGDPDRRLRPDRPPRAPPLRPGLAASSGQRRDAAVFHVVEDELAQGQLGVERGADAVDHLRRRQLAGRRGRGRGSRRGRPARRRAAAGRGR